MRRRILGLALAAAVVGLAGCDFEDFGSSDRYTDDFHYSYPLKSGGRLAVENFNGSIDIAGWDQDTVDISGTRYAATPELRDAIKIDISAQPDSVTIRTVRPFERRGNMGARYVIKVPRAAMLDRITSSNGAVRINDVDGPARVRASNGRVRAINLKGNLDAQTSNGGIEVQAVSGSVTLRTSNGRIHAEDLTGALDASTSNGGISAVLAKSEAGRPVRLQTTNGSVDLSLSTNNQSDVRISTSNGGISVRLPISVNANLIASTSNASITTEFDVKTRGAISKHHLEGTIGNGGPLIDLSTSNGGIRILKM